MNTNLFGVVKKIVEEQGTNILNDSKLPWVWTAFVAARPRACVRPIGSTTVRLTGAAFWASVLFVLSSAEQ
jgi:hypothetical protein